MSDLDNEEIEATRNLKVKGSNINQKYIIHLTDEEYRKVIDIAQKDILRQLIDDNIPKKENIITGELEYSPNTNDNSFLVHQILDLLQESEDK